MKRTGSSAANARGASPSGLVLILLSSLACLYVGGRLWQDSQVQHELVRLAEHAHPERTTSAATTVAVSLDDGMKAVMYKEQEKRLAIMEMELTAAKAKGHAEFRTTSGRSGDEDLFRTVTALSENGSSTAPRRLLAVIGVNTGFGHRLRRDSLRRTWMPSGEALRKLEETEGVVIRFTVGRSANAGDMMDRSIDEENKTTNDFFILNDHIEGYDELPKKTKIYFASAVTKWDADFYMKVDDDVYVNLKRLIVLLRKHRDNPKVYLGCMKSGEVFTEPTQRWHEPEWWKMGDGKMYFRHATGQIYALSRALALFVSINRPMLHEYRNEDVSLGSWMLGLDVLHEDERALCCASPPDGECARRRGVGQHCIAVFDWRCSGLCSSADRMAEVHRACGG
eukprot:TRINITY_DN2029_c0_g1_i1.p1 TRINITY_DN2029_c0_g1~~TRINITY_DN2029_c0_g1_i1.p1  ORF type:complete len:396 (+),score=67.56 TRINITY_DN2029_c0_g1_i1:947-2134(+)